jgi:hypothetical protein
MGLIVFVTEPSKAPRAADIFHFRRPEEELQKLAVQAQKNGTDGV